MTSTLNPRTTTTVNRDTTRRANTGHQDHGPSIRRVAMLGAATALAAFGIGAIMQNGGTESLEVPATYSEFGTQLREAASVQSSAADSAAVPMPSIRSGFATQIPEGAAVPQAVDLSGVADWASTTGLSGLSPASVGQGSNFDLPATGPAIPENVR